MSENIDNQEPEEEAVATNEDIYRAALMQLGDSSIEEIFAHHRETVEGFKEFEKLHAVEALKTLWEERGFSPDDPINYVIEALSMYDARMRGSCGQSIAINETQASFMVLAHKQIVESMDILDKGLDRVDEMKAAVLFTQRAVAKMDGLVDEINQNHTRMLEIAETYSEALGGATIQQRILNWLSYGLVAGLFLVLGLIL